MPGSELIARLRQPLDRDPTVGRALPPACLLSLALYARPPSTDFIFDEREALLANPYVRAAADPASGIGWLDAFRRDFWGLTPDFTIGAYRPLPDLLWRAMWRVGLREASAFAFHLPSVLLHGLNGALLAALTFRWTRDRATSWLAGALFLATAVVTEAVSGAVGLADVVAGTAALLALRALDLPLRSMALAIAGATTLGLYAKESALCLVPLVPLAVVFTGGPSSAVRPASRRVRALVAAAASALAFLAYVELRRRAFTLRMPLRDPMDNPLAYAPAASRIAGALRIWASGVGQIVLPLTLSADYSAQQETAPRAVVSLGSVLGGAAMLGPIALAGVVGVRAVRRRDPAMDAKRPALAALVAFALLWMVLAYFPMSNVPVSLPTVRAERFLYLPAIGSAIALAIGFTRLHVAAGARGSRASAAAVALPAVFLAAQAIAARAHSLDYCSELAFWRATCASSPRSAKAHLNYGAVLGAHGDLEGRLAANTEAVRLAPRWAAASVYQGDVLCLLHRPDEAAQFTARGMEAAPNDAALVDVALRCPSEQRALARGSRTRVALEAVAARHPTSRFASALRQATVAPP